MATKNSKTDSIDSTTPSNPGPGLFDRTETQPAEAVKPPTETLNPFDPSRYRLSTNYAELIGTAEHLLEIACRKPGKEAWFRTHPTHRMESMVLETGGDGGGDREVFLVDPGLWPALALESVFGPRLLIQYQTRQGVNAIWPIKLPRSGDKVNPWTRSAIQAATLAESRWVRLESDQVAGCYKARTADGIPDEPKWPDHDFGRLLELSFRDRIISGMDHPVLKRLRGEE